MLELARELGAERGIVAIARVRFLELVERAPGEKDPGKIRAFIAAARDAAGALAARGKMMSGA